MRLSFIGAALALTLGLAAGCGGGGDADAAGTTGTPDASPYTGIELEPPRQTGDFALTDQEGKTVRLSEQRGKVAVVTFLYTRCPDVCPLIAANLNSALRDLGSDRDSVRVLAVSVDPENDTPEAVRAYVRLHKLVPEFHYLIGPRPELEAVWKQFGVASAVNDLDLVDHSALTLLVDPKGLGRVLFPANAQARDVTHDIRLLLAS